jgi:hypothetical protein
MKMSSLMKFRIIDHELCIYEYGLRVQWGINAKLIYSQRWDVVIVSWAWSVPSIWGSSATKWRKWRRNLSRCYWKSCASVFTASNCMTRDPIGRTHKAQTATMTTICWSYNVSSLETSTGYSGYFSVFEEHKKTAILYIAAAEGGGGGILGNLIAYQGHSGEILRLLLKISLAKRRLGKSYYFVNLNNHCYLTYMFNTCRCTRTTSPGWRCSPWWQCCLPGSVQCEPCFCKEKDALAQVWAKVL